MSTLYHAYGRLGGKFSTVVLLALLGSQAASAQAPAPQLGKAPLKEVLAALTTEEKVKLVVGMGYKPAGYPEGNQPPTDPA
jgi:beta-glucosidase